MKTSYKTKIDAEKAATEQQEQAEQRAEEPENLFFKMKDSYTEILLLPYYGIEGYRNGHYLKTADKYENRIRLSDSRCSIVRIYDNNKVTIKTTLGYALHRNLK